MIVLVIERVRPSLRGLLTRWLVELRPGVFVGTATARVREELWTLVKDARGAGSSLLLHSAPNEQGFVARSAGDPSRAVVNLDGLYLFRRPTRRSTDDEVPF